MGGAAHVAITVALGAAERHGPAAVRWTVDSLLDGAPTAPAVTVHLPGPEGVRARRASPFPFGDAPVVAAALGAEVTSRLTLDSAPATLALRAVGLLRHTPWRDAEPLRAALSRALTGVHLGSDRFTVRADAWSAPRPAGSTFPVGAGVRHAAFAVTGRQQSRATAAVAARVALELARGTVPAGVVHLPHLPGAASLLDDLAAEGVWSRFHLN
ncbi:hypothetical protein [Kineococcus sp. SYSU DK003]|uniref:hypothetical protein n=1 Tax=Kineococcus sp. SYSU DK003 TaxID=3383124 RepID=UPI003D7EC64B